jgi:cyclase
LPGAAVTAGWTTVAGVAARRLVILGKHTWSAGAPYRCAFTRLLFTVSGDCASTRKVTMETFMTRNLHPLALLIAGLVLGGCGEEPSSTGDPPTETQTFTACEDTFTLTSPDPNLVWTPNAIHLVSEKLAPGVFAIYDDKADEYGPEGKPLATSGGFVIGENGVLLVETMINRQLFCQVIDLVRAETDKPIQYVVNTSSHGDHAFGNAFLAKDIHVVQHKNTAQFIAEHFEEDIAFMTANFGTESGLEEITPVAADILVENEGWSVDLGGISVEAKYYGFGQTDGDLFVRVPSAKVVWTGNALIAEKPAIPWLLAGHAEESGITLSAVKAASPEDAVVVPGHGRPMSLDGFDFSVDYLGTLVSEVKTSVDSGATVEETVSAVTMEPFQGYALWGWIHTTVNVPATYSELKK